MTQGISQVFKFVSENTNFSATLGVVSSSMDKKTILIWGAINNTTNEKWVPELNDITHSWPDATWTPVSQTQAGLFDSAYRRETQARQDWLQSI